MAQTKYLDFDLLIEPAAQDYRARVLNSPAGQATADFKFPFTDQDLKILHLTVGQTRRNVRRIDSPQIQEAKDFGGRLFNAVLSGEVRGAFRASVEEATRQDMGLRLRLRFANTPQLFDLPWEYLYNPSLNRFIALSSRTPIVRYIELPESIRPLRIQPPLRVLGMISNPTDYPELDVHQEWTRLDNALGDLQARGLLVLERMELPTLDALRRKLRQGEYHIFHFIGHGGFDHRTQDGVLILQDEQGKGRRVSGQFLGTTLSDHSSLRLAVLNSCEGARTSDDDSFAGVAQTLVQQGIPAVIAMQFEITDEASIIFAREFYSALGDAYPVDAALAEARRGIYTQANDLEWGTPVLYMRSPDGVIFDVGKLPMPPAHVPSVLPPIQKSAPVPVTLPERSAQKVVTPPSRSASAPAPTRFLTRSKAVLFGGVLLLSMIAIGAFLFAGNANDPNLALTPTLSNIPPTAASAAQSSPVPTSPFVSAALPTPNHTQTINAENTLVSSAAIADEQARTATAQADSATETARINADQSAGTATAAAMTAAAPAPTQPPTVIQPAPARPTSVPARPTLRSPTVSLSSALFDFENPTTWKIGDQKFGGLSQSAEQRRTGNFSGKLAYDFPAVNDEFVVFQQTRSLPSNANALTAWVYGDGSGHFLNAWVTDSSATKWAFTFGQISHTGWRQLVAKFDPGLGWPNAAIAPADRTTVSLPMIRFDALVLDAVPHGRASKGVIYVDDIFPAELSSTGAASTPNALAQPNCEITSPLDDAIVSGLVPIIGTAVTPTFDRWEIAHRPAWISSWLAPFRLPRSREQIQDGKLMDWQTSSVGNGDYYLRLIVYSRDGAAVCEKTIRLRIRN